MHLDYHGLHQFLNLLHFEKKNQTQNQTPVWKMKSTGLEDHNVGLHQQALLFYFDSCYKWSVANFLNAFKNEIT